MGARVRVDGLDVADACSLRERFGGDFEIRADTASAIPWVEIATEGPLSDLLRRLEDWTTASGLPLVRITLDGRAYVLRAAAPPGTTDDAELLPSAFPVA
jgi:hypothetical protein